MIIDWRSVVMVRRLRQHATKARAEAAAWEAEGINPSLVELRRRDADLVERTAWLIDKRR